MDEPKIPGGQGAHGSAQPCRDATTNAIAPQATPPRPAPRITGRNLAAVAVGGLCGAGLRVGLGLWFPDGPGFPATTLAINVAGTAALGALTSYWQVTRRGPGWLRAGVGTGFLGAFTTFSALILFALGAGAGAVVLDLAVSLVLCVAAAWAAMAVVERVLDRGAPAGPAPAAGSRHPGTPDAGGPT
ncbi:CrcB family protein [Arthrobacter sp. UCD-GKA]|uniref:fluoride efflux transporter FluC n=1 Tax=Arthrobacter sp. UCD-GKA TaxID=1913576 RepID=UPI0009F2903E|nr:CrcB family protein [Arthrobacter sp. UCD-GKA]